MASIPRFRRVAFLVGTAVAVLAYQAPPTAPPTQDSVVLSQTSGSANGVLASGQLNGAYVAYHAYQSNSTTVPIDNFSSSASTGEVVAFTNRRPMAITTAITTPVWTAGADAVKVSFAPEIAIPVTVWVIKGPFADGRQKALDMNGAAAQIWIDQGMGVAFQSYDIRDATQFSQFLAFDCSMVGALQAAIPPVAGQINVYLVDTVDGALGYGQACGVGGTLGGVMAAVSSSAPDDLLTHEMGHNFGLTDLYPTSTGFDATNVMFKFSSTRQYFTEGQIFRAHMTPSSSLNFLYAARPGQPTRLCTASANNNQCPPLSKRIWADGVFPPN